MAVTVYSSALQIPKGTTADRPAQPTAGMLFFNTDTDDVEKWDPIYSGWYSLTLKYYRYWRYRQISAITGHHPRVSRIVLISDKYQEYTVASFTSDNCADSGTIPSDGNTWVYDFGSNPQRIISAYISSTYGGGLRASNIAIDYSNDNSNWTAAWLGIAHNYIGGQYAPTVITAAQCGPIDIFGAPKK